MLSHTHPCNCFSNCIFSKSLHAQSSDASGKPGYFSHEYTNNPKNSGDLALSEMWHVMSAHICPLFFFFLLTLSSDIFTSCNSVAGIVFIF